MSRRTTCEGVASSSAHSRSKTSFLRGSIRIVRRAVRSSRATAVLEDATEYVDYDYNRTRMGVVPSAMSLTDSGLGACLALSALWGLIVLAGLLRPRSLGFVRRTLVPLGA